MVEDYPNRWQSYCARGERYEKIGLYKEALQDYEICFTMQESPRISDGLYALAQLHERMGDYASAIDSRKRIIQSLKDDCQIISGEPVDAQNREISRLHVLS